MATVTVTLKTDVPATSIKGVRDLSNEFKGLGQASAGLKIQFNDTFSVLKGVLGADIIKSGFGALKNAAGQLFDLLVTDGVAAAQQEEDAIRRMNVALAQAGDFSVAASEDMQAFAAQIQRTTKIGDDTAISILALAKVYGRTNEETKSLTAAAIELSAATGVSLETAVKNLGKTYSGTTGRLAESLPAVKELTKEQLKAGAAIEYVLARLGGSAQGQIATFSGATAQAANSWEDLTEGLGNAIIKNGAIIGGIQETSKIFQELGGRINDNQSFLQALVADGFVGLLDATALLLNVLDPIGRAGQIAFYGLLGAVDALKLGIYTLVVGPFGALAKVISLLPGAGDAAEKTADAIGSAMAGMAADLNANVAAMDKALSGPTDTAKAFEDGILRIREAAIRGSSGQQNLNAELERMSAAAAAAKGTVAELTKEQIKLGDQGKRIADQIAAQDPNVKYEQELAALRAALEQKKIVEEEYALAQAELQIQRDEAVSAKYEEEAQRLIEQNQRLMEIDANANTARIDDNNRRLKQILESEKLTAKDRERVAKDFAAAEAKVDRERLQATKDALGQATQLFGDHTAAYKIAASASALIATYEGATKAANAVVGVPFIGPGLAVAAAGLFIANGLKNVAAINGVKLASGLTEVPAGYPNDTFAASLTSGERVVNVEQNRDLTDYIASQSGNREILEAILQVLMRIASQPVPAVIGSEAVFNAVNHEINSGRRLAA